MNQTSSKATEEEEEEGGRERRMNAAIESQHSQFHESQQNDDFLEQMLSTIPSCSWPPNSHELSPPNVNPNTDRNAIDPDLKSLLQLQLLGLPLSLGDPDSVDASAFISQAAAEASVQTLYNGLAGSLHANAQSADQLHFHSPPPPSQGVSLGGGPKGGMNQAPPVSASTGGSSGAGAPQRQRVRARRGQATDPHSIAERLRRERIAERMKALQELVPNANKTDKASMLDEIIDYVKFLQLQVKVLSMSRLGGGAPAAPLAAGMNSEGLVGQSGDEGTQTAPTNDGMTVAEHQVAKLMEEDMGSAMQYLQGKGLCLMPISLATAISTTTSLAHTQSRSHIDYNGNRHDVNGNQHHHSLLSSAPSSNGAGDHPTPNSSIKDPSNS